VTPSRGLNMGITDWYIPFDFSCFSCISSEIEPPRLIINISALILFKIVSSSIGSRVIFTDVSS